MQDVPPLSPVATATNNTPALISLIANQDGESQGASEILTVNNLDKVGPRLVEGQHTYCRTL